MRFLSLLLLAAICTAVPASAGVLWHGRHNAVIVNGDDATVAEKTAASELGHYLKEITGRRFTVGTSTAAATPVIYVGRTSFAAAHGVGADTLEPDEWVIRTVGDNLILAGGGTRGTLYADYHFLEDVLGVHWWNAYSETVPKQPNLTVPELDLHGKPTFRYRDIYMLYAADGGRFAARSRLNRQGDQSIRPEYGGEMDYGPPYHVHTFYTYFPPDEHFEDHPDWYSLIDGERRAERHQLCLTNPELREAFLAKLIDYIESSHAEAKAAGLPPPLVFSVSQNDWDGHCECEACQAIAEAEGSEVGPLLNFVNYLADGIAEDHPDVSISTLAYMYTQTAPKTIRPRDNVIIRLCDTHSNFTRSIVTPENRDFREHLLSWANIAGNLRIWDYAVTYAPYYGLPLPTAHTYPVDYRYYATHNVEGVFTEHEYPILADMRDLKVWLMMKCLEDPFQDYDALVRTFTDGFYGPAGPAIRQYVAELTEAGDEKISYLSMSASPQSYRYLDLDFIVRAQAIFDEAESLVEGRPELLERVRHARLPLDRASVIRFPALMREWLGRSEAPDAIPVDRDAVAHRYQATWHTEIERRYAEGKQAEERARCDAEVEALTARKAFVPIPERFRDLPPESVFSYTADQTRNWRNQVKVVPLAESESGITNRLVIPDDQLDRYKLPMPWGAYDTIAKEGRPGDPIRFADVPDAGYHWYRMGSFTLRPSHYVYFFWSWVIQLDVGDVVDADDPDAEFEVWANIRFEGPAFPHGDQGDENAIEVERVVLVKQ